MSKCRFKSTNRTRNTTYEAWSGTCKDRDMKRIEEEEEDHNKTDGKEQEERTRDKKSIV